MKAVQTNRAVVIDGNGIIYRAYYATVHYKNEEDRNKLFYKTVNMIKRLIQEIIFMDNYEYVVIVFDTSRATFRRESFENYKAQRKPTPSILIQNRDWIQNEIKLLGVPILYSPKEFEADDTVATVSDFFKSKGIMVDVVTGDNDLLQLVDENTRSLIFSPKQKEYVIHDIENFKTLNDGLEPWQIPHLKALTGDNSDNYPGVKSFGPKTSLDLLLRYQSIEGIYQNISELSQKHRDKLLESKEDAFFYLNLATLVRTVKIPEDLDFYRWNGS